MEDVGLNGLCFVSNVKLPVNGKYLLYFVIPLGKVTFRVSGFVRWSIPLGSTQYKYGCQLFLTEWQRATLERIMNQYSAQLYETAIAAYRRTMDLTPSGRQSEDQH